MTNILEICQDAADELSLVSPSGLVGSLDDTARKLLRHLSKTCAMLAGRYDWQVLRTQHTFATTAAPEQAGAIPANFLRFVQNSMYNRTERRHVRGPLTPMEWQAYQASTTTPVFDHFYQRGNTIFLTPTPPAGETIAFEYIKNAIGYGPTNVDVTRFTSDADTPYLDAELLTMGVIYRFRQAEKLDYAEEQRDFELRYADMVKQDGGRRVLDLDDNLLERTEGQQLDYMVVT